MTVACITFLRRRCFQPALLCALFLAGGPASLRADVPADDRAIEDLYRAYHADMDARRAAGVSGYDRPFWTKWEQRFRDVRAATTEPTTRRMHLLGELGTIQNNLNMTEAAVETWSAQEELAAQLGKYQQQTVSLNGLIGLLTPKLPEALRQEYLAGLARKIDAGFDRMARTPEGTRPENLAWFAATFEILGMTCLNEARRPAADGAGAAQMQARRQTLYAGAATALARALTLDQSDARQTVNRKMNLAEAKRGMGAFAEAAALYDELAQAGQTVVSRMWMAHNAAILRFRADPAGYIAALEQILKTYPPDDDLPALMQELGFAYRRAGKIDDAIRVFRSVVELDKTEAKTSNMLILAELYASQGNTTAAESIFQEIVAHYPNTAAAQTAHERLKMPKQALVALSQRAVDPAQDGSPRPVAVSAPAATSPAADPASHPRAENATRSHGVLGACAAGVILLVIGGLYLIRKRGTTPGRLARP